jgi:uridine kinase
MIFIGLAGPSGAGKTTVSNYLATYFGDDFEHIRQDDYLKDPGTFPVIGQFRNWEHPYNYKFDLIYEHIKKLKQGEEVSSKTFAWRENESMHEFVLKPKKFILVEGSLILTNEDLSSSFDKKIYLEIPSSLILERRAKRMGQQHHPEYDINVTIPEFERHGMMQKISADYIVDGTADPKTVTQLIRDIIIK